MQLLTSQTVVKVPVFPPPPRIFLGYTDGLSGGARTCGEGAEGGPYPNLLAANILNS